MPSSIKVQCPLSAVRVGPGYDRDAGAERTAARPIAAYLKFGEGGVYEFWGYSRLWFVRTAALRAQTCLSDSNTTENHLDISSNSILME